MRRRPRLIRGGLDEATAAMAFSRPGIDPREWVTVATVVDQDPVAFDQDLGCYLVTVACQPSKKVVRCRVMGQVAGKQEADWYPYIPGDEVCVVFPEGHERSGAIIVGRLNNSVDQAPQKIAGQDATTNAFGYRRTTAPFVHEVSGPYLLRSALTGAMLGLDAKGGVTIRDGQGAALQFAPDHFTYIGPPSNGPGSSSEVLFQLDVTNHRATLQIGDAALVLSGSQASPQANAIAVSGALTLQTAGNPAAEHVATTEAVFNIVSLVFDALATVLALPANAGPLTGAALALLLKYPTSQTSFLSAAPLLAPAEPFLPTLGAAIQAAFAAATQKPPGTPALGQSSPGIGCVGLLAG